jgi:hypothetical protein
MGGAGGTRRGKVKPRISQLFNGGGG